MEQRRRKRWEGETEGDENTKERERNLTGGDGEIYPGSCCVISFHKKCLV